MKKKSLASMQKDAITYFQEEFHTTHTLSDLAYELAVCKVKGMKPMKKSKIARLYKRLIEHPDPIGP